MSWPDRRQLASRKRASASAAAPAAGQEAIGLADPAGRGESVDALEKRWALRRHGQFLSLRVVKKKGRGKTPAR